MTTQLPQHWTKHKLADLIRDQELEIGDGYRAKNSEMDSDGLPFIRVRDLNNGFQFDDADLLSFKSVEKAREKVCETNDCVITTKGTFGRVAYVEADTQKFVYAPQLCYWRINNKERIDPRFLFYWLQGPDFLAQAHRVKSSTDMADYASLTDLRAMTISLPSLMEQQKIAAVLAAYDELVENNQQRIAVMKSLAAEIYREWFVRLRFPSHKKTKFVDRMPNGWREATIGEVCKVARGSSPRPKADTRFFAGGEIPWVKIADATASNMYIYETREKINEFGATFSRRLPSGSLIIATSGTLGFSIFLGVEGCVHDGWIYLTQYQHGLKPVFFYYVVNALRTYLNNLSYGAAIQNVNTDIIRSLPFNLPPTSILDAFYRQVEPMHEAIQVCAKATLQVRAARELLLSRLISGKVSVTDCDIKFPSNMDTSILDSSEAELAHA